MSCISHENVVEICERFAKHFANNKIELNFCNSYTCLIAVVLSAQATDKRVNIVTSKLFKIADTPDKMLKLGYEKLCKYINSIGLYKNKAKYIIELSNKLISDFNGTVPNNIEDLLSLPGVGRKTANVVLNHIFHQPTIAVDTHVFRVSRRLALSSGQNPEKVEQDLMNIIPDRYKINIGYQILLHGRYVCKAIKPDCENCILKDICPFVYNCRSNF